MKNGYYVEMGLQAGMTSYDPVLREGGGTSGKTCLQCSFTWMLDGTPIE